MDLATRLHPQESIEDITESNWSGPFAPIFSHSSSPSKRLSSISKRALRSLTPPLSRRIAAAPTLLDYSATKGAIVAFTRSLQSALVDKKIRVNAVAPGPIWTLEIPSTFPADKTAKFGSDVPMGRAGEPREVAPCYVFFASEDGSYFTGQLLHLNGGGIVNG